MLQINDPEFIAQVEKGVPIEELEKRMRLGNYSEVGFLGKEESLLDVVHTDEETIRKLGVTHVQIADRLEYFILRYVQGNADFFNPNKRLTGQKLVDAYETFEMEGIDVDQLYQIVGHTRRGYQLCPWGDDTEPTTKIYLIPGGHHPYSNLEITVKNNKSDESLSFPGLIVHLIKDHHFYEGKQSSYRVDPENAVRVLDIKL